MKKIILLAVVFMCFALKPTFSGGFSWEETYQAWFTSANQPSCDPWASPKRCVLKMPLTLSMKHQQGKTFTTMVYLGGKDVGRLSTSKPDKIASIQWPANYTGTVNVSLRSCEDISQQCFTFSFVVDVKP